MHWLKPWHVILITLALAVAVGGCRLEGGEEEDTLPTADYDTLKFIVDDVGAAWEIDATGRETMRRGYYYDKDFDGEGDYFYQLDKPAAGLFGLAFGDDGYANGAKAFVMTRVTGGKTQYEIPLKSLTKWIRDGAALGYLAGRYVDSPNVLVYNDRVNDVELEAPLTGEREAFKYQFLNMGFLSPQAEPPPVDDDADDAADDDTADDDEKDMLEPFAFGDTNIHCSEYKKFCRAWRDNGDPPGALFDPYDPKRAAGEWSVGWCQQVMADRDDGSSGTRYNTCLVGCTDSGGIEGCIERCRVTRMEDLYGCFGESGPELDDVLYLVERPGETSGTARFQAEKGFTLTGKDKLTVFFDYKDAECKFNAFGPEEENKGYYYLGRVEVSFTSGAYGTKTFTAKPSAQFGCNSFQDKRMLGFTFDGLTNGDYEFTIKLLDIKVQSGKMPRFQDMTDEEWESHVDSLIRSSACVKEGTAYQGAFSISDYEGHDGKRGGPGAEGLSMNYYEIFETGLDKYNLGKGFVDVRAANPRYFYNMEDQDIAIIQSYVWSTVGRETFGDFTNDDLNRGIVFTTTQDIRGTKFDSTDDIQAWAFYLDQPMGSGMFTFYGDAGWNIYPKGPSGGNMDQGFIRGAFADTWLHMPFRPMPAVSEYSGCAFDPTVWADFIFDIYPDGLSMTSFEGMDYKEVVESMDDYSAAPYWRCRIKCLRKINAGINGCQSLDQCVDQCPSTKPAGAQSYDLYDAGFMGLYLKAKVTIPSEFLVSPNYEDLFFPTESEDPRAEEWQPLRIGLYVIASDGQLTGLPGGYVDLVLGKEDYIIRLPYFPYLPEKYLTIGGNAKDAEQSQMFIGIFGADDAPYGINAYPSSEPDTSDWFYYPLWGANWVSPDMEGWSIAVREGDSLTGLVSPFDIVVDIEFGKLSPIGEDDLVP